MALMPPPEMATSAGPVLILKAAALAGGAGVAICRLKIGTSKTEGNDSHRLAASSCL